MLRTHYSNEIKNAKGKPVTVCGWLKEIRDIGKIRFLVLQDARGTTQVTLVKGRVNDKLWAVIPELTKETVLSIEGVVKEMKEAPNGVEIQPEKIQVLSPAEAPLPLDVSGKITSNLDTRLDWRSLDLRVAKHAAIFKIQSTIVAGFQEYLNEQGFVNVATPCIIGSTSEGGADVFKLDYFKKPAFLRQDPQLHRQLTVASGLDKVYDLGPSWRAEPSHTTRHLCEYRSCAVEMGFITDEHDVMRLEEQMIVHALNKVKKENKDELALLGVNLEIPKTPFPEITFPEIYDILKKLGKKLPRDTDVDSETESILAKHVKEKHDNDFFFINGFPSSVKPFYVMHRDAQPEFARSVDLVYKGLEQSSGGQREHRYEKIIEQVKQKKLNPELLKWFTEVFKYGVPPHGGFAIGIERFTKQLLNLDNIRDATLFTRDPTRNLP